MRYHWDSSGREVPPRGTPVGHLVLCGCDLSLFGMDSVWALDGLLPGVGLGAEVQLEKTDNVSCDTNRNQSQTDLLSGTCLGSAM